MTELYFNYIFAMGILHNNTAINHTKRCHVYQPFGGWKFKLNLLIVYWIMFNVDWYGCLMFVLKAISYTIVCHCEEISNT